MEANTTQHGVFQENYPQKSAATSSSWHKLWYCNHILSKFVSVCWLMKTAFCVSLSSSCKSGRTVLFNWLHLAFPSLFLVPYFTNFLVTGLVERSLSEEVLDPTAGQASISYVMVCSLAIYDKRRKQTNKLLKPTHWNVNNLSFSLTKKNNGHSQSFSCCASTR